MEFLLRIVFVFFGFVLALVMGSLFYFELSWWLERRKWMNKYEKTLRR
ncbi:hypothetical protein PYCH_14120 [Pyrococcus yayanosii CH1]|uniref:Uncharacterized protein n=1 Tax=Pyrococcus yayanosii (strain CH1 / JCM 16557) TaxID=529709 RepID=F8AG28_PYRYC|nr:hypothetical protein PYCH_14120 [Pyrococcus yayanosii CH1]